MLIRELALLKKIVKNADEQDGLTGIFNRSAFIQKTKELLSENSEKSYCLIRWNFVNFKLFNSLFGEESGNDVLKNFAKSLSDKYSNKGVVGRFYGDNFVLCTERVLYDVDFCENVIDCGLLRKKYNYDFIINYAVFEIEDNTLTVSDICDRAKMALESIKGSYSKRNIIYNDNLRKQMMAEQYILNTMEEALKNREFFICFQPIFGLSANRTVCAEALIRWANPSRGFISPSEFLPIFEKNGFIIKLDNFVWEEVCLFLRKSIDNNENVLPISANISVINLYNRELCNNIINLLKKYNIPPKFFRLEITEDIYCKDGTRLLETMKILKDYGIKFILDDFGKWYSSLNILKNVPVDFIKLDINLIKDMENSDKAGTILVNIVRLAKWLNIGVVAEGVENKTQFNFLRSIGCDGIQGLFFSKPLDCVNYKTFITKEERSDKAGEEDINIDYIDFDDVFRTDNFTGNILSDMIGAMGIYELTGERLTVLRVNNNYFRIFEINAQNILSYSNNAVTSVENGDRNNLLNTCRSAALSLKTEAVIVRRNIRNNKQIRLEVKIRYIGKICDSAVFYFVMNEISAQRQAEINALNEAVEIRKNYDVMKNYYNAVPSGIVELGKEESFRIKNYNSESYRILGFKDGESFKEAIEIKKDYPVENEEARKFGSALSSVYNDNSETLIIMAMKNGNEKIAVNLKCVTGGEDKRSVICAFIKIPQVI